MRELWTPRATDETLCEWSVWDFLTPSGCNAHVRRFGHGCASKPRARTPLVTECGYPPCGRQLTAAICCRFRREGTGDGPPRWGFLRPGQLSSRAVASAERREGTGARSFETTSPARGDGCRCVPMRLVTTRNLCPIAGHRCAVKTLSFRVRSRYQRQDMVRMQHAVDRLITTCKWLSALRSDEFVHAAACAGCKRLACGK